MNTIRNKTIAFDDLYMSIKEAALWATDYLGKKVTTSNISYHYCPIKARKGY